MEILRWSQDEEFEKFKKKGPPRGGPPWKGRRERSPKEREELLNDVRNVFDFDVLRRECGFRAALNPG